MRLPLIIADSGMKIPLDPNQSESLTYS